MTNETTVADMAGDGLPVIACGVLAIDLQRVASDMGVPIRLRCLPGGLHATPRELRRRLQETIDELSPEAAGSRLVIAYGVCGRGLVGLRARGVPLVIPRVHDCIALFLGSDTRYREEFARHPGTFYLSAGWVEEKGADGPSWKMGSDGEASLPAAGDQQLDTVYGPENASHIRYFLDSWKRNYTRSAFIDTGVGGAATRYERMARAMARDYGWEYARLEGQHDLLRKALTATATTDEILVVPPGAGTIHDGLRRRLDATRSGNAASGSPADGMVAAADASQAAAQTAPPAGLGLGIDAGGTYTDVVLFDFGARRILDKGKALTTCWDYRLGIRAALERLDRTLLATTDLVAVSTTLATNAIVEGRGQKTGLLVMPPYGWRDIAGFQHTPLALIDGQLEINGTELQPVRPEQVRAIAREMVHRHGVSAFAVGGYASHVNPAHELAVRDAIMAETGLAATCGHELSEGLDYRVRAETAALNARIIPCLRGLLDRLPATLAAVGVRAPVMVVRSDGSLMNFEAALARPLETMLSGPAASAAGAAWLAGCRNALVVDIGGTTTDSAVIRDGVVKMCDDGATIGGWQTHIRALDLRTAGLGGDSHIRFEQGVFQIGPRRVTPLCRMAAGSPGADAALAWIESHADGVAIRHDEGTILMRGGGREQAPLLPDEQRLMDLLAERPRSLHELTVLLGKLHFSLLPVARLDAWQMVQRCALTPTDVLHAAGTIACWDRAAAERGCALAARLARMPVAQLVPVLMRQFERTLAAELLKKQIAEDIPIPSLDRQPVARALIDRLLDGNGDGYCMRFALRHPVIGIGAPAGCFVPAAAALLGGDALVPEHADVANAVGAITGSVSFRRRVVISVDELGWYRLNGVPDAPTFQQIEDAVEQGCTYLRETLTNLARQAGGRDIAVEIVTGDSQAAAADGGTIFINRTIEGRVSGVPERSGA